MQKKTLLKNSAYVVETILWCKCWCMNGVACVRKTIIFNLKNKTIIPHMNAFYWNANIHTYKFKHYIYIHMCKHMKCIYIKTYSYNCNICIVRFQTWTSQHSHENATTKKQQNKYKNIHLYLGFFAVSLRFFFRTMSINKNEEKFSWSVFRCSCLNAKKI